MLSAEENKQIVEAIRLSEKKTSGEIRVFVESNCSFINPMDRALEVFYGLKMNETDDRNGVLIYVAIKDRQLAIYGDEGINQRVDSTYWQNAVQLMKQAFKNEDYPAGICNAAKVIGETLQKEFPYTNEDKNELPDEIVFGK